MNTIHPWLDTDEVKRLAERLMQPQAAPPLSPDEPAFDRSFEGFSLTDGKLVANPPARSSFAHPQPLPSRPTAAAAPWQAVASAPLVPAAEQPQAAPRATARSEDIPAPAQVMASTAVNDFGIWVHAMFSATELFILDDQGKLIFGEETQRHLPALARTMAIPPHPSAQMPSHVHIKIGARSTLAILPATTAHGNVVIGMILPQSIDSAAARSIVSRLESALSSRSEE
jgi:hypothetical protein